ncbi:hypothetical protein E4H04_07090 [Candidatus Bathyarchaeota archaeon]|nr:MAG: hypothetical protein E4H04_07090 [Candidatus Bathyarchaeota archaeon]
MNPKEYTITIANEAGLKEPSIGELTDWIVEHKGKQGIEEILSAIKDDKIARMTPIGKKQDKFIVDKLEYSNFFNGVAIKYSNKGWYDESIAIFEALLERTPNDTGISINYGASLAQKIESDYHNTQQMDFTKLKKARELIFKAYNIDKEISDVWRDLPAYKNLCYLRALEAIRYYNLKEAVTAFILSWISIEMSLYRIWYQYLVKNGESNTSINKKYIRWDPEFIIQTLYLSNFMPFKELKNDLDTMRGIRNQLFHGEIDNPTIGQAKRCLETALKMVAVVV